MLTCLQLRAAAERQAVNSKVQGSAADLIKRGMVLLDSQLRTHPSGGAARLILQVIFHCVCANLMDFGQIVLDQACLLSVQPSLLLCWP